MLPPVFHLICRDCKQSSRLWRQLFTVWWYKPLGLIKPDLGACARSWGSLELQSRVLCSRLAAVSCCLCSQKSLFWRGSVYYILAYSLILTDLNYPLLCHMNYRQFIKILISSKHGGGVGVFMPVSQSPASGDFSRRI